jgi:hypothetical protein
MRCGRTEANGCAMLLLPAPQAWVVAGSEWPGEALHIQAYSPGNETRLVEDVCGGPSRSALRISPAGSNARNPAQLGEASHARACRAGKQMFLRDGAELVATLGSLKAVLRWKHVSTVVEIRVTSPVVNAGASPAGFSRTVVQLEQNDDPLHSGRTFPG